MELCEEEIVNYQKKVVELFKRKREGAIFHEEYDRDYKEYSERIAELQAWQTKYKEDNLAAEISKQRLDEIRAVPERKLKSLRRGDHENTARMHQSMSTAASLRSAD